MLPVLLGQTPDHQAFARLLQHLSAAAHFIKHMIGQALKALHIDIHNAVRRVARHQILLGLHGKLFRHEQHIPLPGMGNGIPDDLLLQTVRFSRTGTADDQL